MSFLLVVAGLCVSILVSLAIARIIAFGNGDDEDSHPTAQRTR